MTPPILVTGAAGFLGMHVAARLLGTGHQVVGVDEINAYYDPALKHARLARLQTFSGFVFERLDVADDAALRTLFKKHSFKAVVHLAAQAGVRHSLRDPFAYQRSNLAGMTSVLEACRHHRIEHLLYASSSSVYGGNTKVPFHEDDRVDTPVSFYAATKRANELMAHTYSHLYSLPATGLRFFTVYGPWGRPDMAYWTFTQAVLEGRPIEVYGQGAPSRDFTYCDDVVGAIERLIGLPPDTGAAAQGAGGGNKAAAPHRILNVGNSNPHTVNELIGCIESITGRSAQRIDQPLPPGDVESTFADSGRLEALTGFRPSTSLRDGLAQFVEWFRQYHRL